VARGVDARVRVTPCAARGSIIDNATCVMEKFPKNFFLHVVRSDFAARSHHALQLPAKTNVNCDMRSRGAAAIGTAQHTARCDLSATRKMNPREFEHRDEPRCKAHCVLVSWC
jgi:hypothetical protein